jgi:putative hemolysin
MLSDLGLVLALILLNGLLALSELAIVGSKRLRLTRLAAEGSAGAASALSLAAEPTRFLSTVQVGITAIGILNGAIGEATLTRPVRAALEGVPITAPYAEPLSLAAVVVGITYLSLILGELVPKRLALTDPERIATLISRPMRLLARLGTPVVWLLSVSTDGVLRLVRARKVARTDVTIEEIRVLIEQGGAQGVLEPGEQLMMTNVLNLDQRRVSSVLTPRADVVFLDLRQPVEWNLSMLRERPHAVMPLCEGGLQRVIGFVRAKRVLEQVLGGRTLDLRTLAEPALFVPEAATVMSLLEEFRRSRLSVALVVDEFGAVEGIVSVSDVMASIVGDAPDFGRSDQVVIRREDGSWLLDGGLDIETVARALEDDSLAEEAERFNYRTLGGLAMVALERVPRTGDTFERRGHRFEVVDMDGNRVDRILATPRRLAAGEKR